MLVILLSGPKRSSLEAGENERSQGNVSRRAFKVQNSQGSEGQSYAMFVHHPLSVLDKLSACAASYKKVASADLEKETYDSFSVRAHRNSSVGCS